MTPYTNSSDLSGAIRALRVALEKEPANGPFHYALAALLALSGRWEEAQGPLQEADALDVNTQVLREWLEKADEVNQGRR